MKIPTELKEAISGLPSKEKDKLIFRLLRHDLNLANRLMFELVSADTVADRREHIKARLAKLIQHATDDFYSPGYLNMDVRSMSGEISEYVYITKDKAGEAHLNLWMLNEVLEKNNHKILDFTFGKAYKFNIAVIARAFKIMVSVKKLHEDYLIEFEDDLKKLGKLIGDNPYLMDIAIANGLDVNWLFHAQIPDNIEQIQKELRAAGYLK